MLAQIYEIQTPEEAQNCIALGVDRIGSVILSASEWKKPELREVIRLTDRTETRSNLIPLFGDWQTLCRAMDYYRPHFVHFCDNLTDAQGHQVDLSPYILLQEKFKSSFPEIGIVRSIPVPPAGLAPDFPCLDLIHPLEGVSDFFLIDTWLGKEPVEGFVGITGTLADMERAKAVVLQSSVPVLLAGGLSPENVFGAMIEVLPAGADSCTHTNQGDRSGKPIRFKKDFVKVERFVKELRRAETAFPSRREDLARHLAGFTEELQLKVAALPAHSVRPHQLLAIEDLEEKIALTEKQLRHLDLILSGKRSRLALRTAQGQP
jgi:phosphoribosylanthranilate isomerase